MNTKLAIAVVVALVVLAAGYWYWKSTGSQVPLTSEQQALDAATKGADAITQSVTQGVLPSLNVPQNPLGGATDVNPVTKTNPFSGIKTNPFR